MADTTDASPSQPPSQGLSTKPSLAFREGTSTAILKVLDEIDRQESKRIQSGFNEVSFTLGVLNCFLIIYTFGAYPEHFWILYLVEMFYFIPVKFMEMISEKPNQAFYYLDFCWIMNFLGVAAFMVLVFGGDSVPDWFYTHLFLAVQGVTCGILLGATFGLDFIAIVFHETKTMTSFFIHVIPPLLFYVMKWKADVVREVWPNTFHLNHDVVFFPTFGEGGQFIGTVFGNSWTLYMAWLISYTLWQLFIGFNMPKKGRFDTVFHSTMKGGLCITIGTLFWKRPKAKSIEQMEANSYELRDLFVYMTMHFIAATGSLFVLAYPSSLDKRIHGFLLILCAIICTWRGAKKYTYYSTKMYSRVIRKQFAAEISAKND